MVRGSTCQAFFESPPILLQLRFPSQRICHHLHDRRSRRAHRSQQAGFFALSADAGDNLHLVVSAGTPATQFPELLLYDPNGNLVAVAAGNAPDGSSSVIDFTVPGGDAGAWSAEVAGSSGPPIRIRTCLTTIFSIRGDTGVGPINPIPPSTVPEPSAFTLFVMPLAALVLFSRRKKSA